MDDEFENPTDESGSDDDAEDEHDDPGHGPETSSTHEQVLDNDESMGGQQHSELGDNPQPMVVQSNIHVNLRFIDFGSLVWKGEATFDQFRHTANNTFKLYDKERTVLSKHVRKELYTNVWLWLIVEDSFGFLTLRGFIHVQSVDFTAKYVTIQWNLKCFTHEQYHINPTGMYLACDFIPHLWSSKVSYDLINAVNEVCYIWYCCIQYHVVCTTGTL